LLLTYIHDKRAEKGKAVIKINTWNELIKRISHQSSLM